MNWRFRTLIEPAGNWLRRQARGVPALRSAWFLMHAIKEAMLDSATRSRVQFTREFESTDPWRYATTEGGIPRHSWELHLLDTVRRGNRFRNAIEIGCAEGAFTKRLAERCDSLLAVDFCPAALARARERCDSARVTFSEFDLRKEPLTGSFDLIVIVHVLEYVRSPFVLRAIRRKLVNALTPGGFLLVGSATPDDFVGEHAWWGRWLVCGGIRINEFMASHPDVSALESSSFKVPGHVCRDVLLQRTV